MPGGKLRVLLVGSFSPGALECSYQNAFQALGWEVRTFDIVASIDHSCRFGKIGRVLNEFVPVEPWIRKANREMIVMAQEFQPVILIVFGQSKVRTGALAQLRSLAGVSIVFVWQDPLNNLSEHSIGSLPLYDLVATYSRDTAPQFERLGSRRVEWVPLGCDPCLHPAPGGSASAEATFGADISFIGYWRPERERVLRILLAEFPTLTIRIWGQGWDRHCRGKRDILHVWQGRSVIGNDFAFAVSSSKINLNIIDAGANSAANMRFFEIPCAGGLQVCSACPEMEAEFKHGETIFYFRELADLPDLVRSLLRDDALRQRVAKAAHEKVLGEHTYVHRAMRILDLLDELPARSARKSS